MTWRICDGGVKLYGIACIFIGACWGMGIALRERRRGRRTLSDFRAALTRMAAEIRLTRTAFPDLLERLADACAPDAASFFRSVAGAARHGDAPSVAWRDASDALPLSAADRQTLRELAPVLRGDETEIRQALELAATRFEDSLRELDRVAPGEIRQAAALIFSAAALLVILLY